MNSGADRIADEELDLDVYLKIFWKRKGFIIGLTFTATFLASLICPHLPKIYHAEAILQIGQMSSQRLIEPMVNVMARMHNLQMAADIKKSLHLPEKLGLHEILQTIDIKPVESREGNTFQGSPDLLQLGCSWNDPQTASKILQFIADGVISAHAGLFETDMKTLQAQRQALKAQIANNRNQQDQLRLRIKQAAKQWAINPNYHEPMKNDAGNLSKVDSDDIKRNQEIVAMEESHGDLSNENERLKVRLAQLEEHAAFLQNTKLLAAPMPPEKSIAPRTRLIVLAAFLMSLVAALAASLLAENLPRGKSWQVPGA
jgi:uncharacterized protein involved in exopolysaccharide biosynthesis